MTRGPQLSRTLDIRHRHGSSRAAFVGASELQGLLPTRSFVVTDENVWAAWGHAFGNLEHVLIIPAGEQSKSMAQFEAAVHWLYERGADRNSTVAALGGGVVGDLAGFAASAYMRGIDFIQVPTTLLAQVDSSVGGKVGIDLPNGKNMVGAFHPAQAVYIALETLRTLPERQFANGMAEVWKYGFIMDAALTATLSKEPLRADSPQLEDVVCRCIECKRDVVQEDELDRSGRRAILNFGHTVGHAIEQATGYARLLHGEAIAIGMAAEARIGESLGVTAPGTAEAITECLLSAGLPVSDSLLREPSALLAAMKKDKKASSGRIAMSLVTQVGECKLFEDVPPEVVEAVLRVC